MKKIVFCAVAFLLATSAFARPHGAWGPPGGWHPPGPPGGWGPPRHYHSHSKHVFGSFAFGIGVGSLLAPRSIYYSPPPAPVYSTTTIYTAPPVYAPTVPTYVAPAPVVVSPVVTVPQSVYTEKEPTKLFCRSKNNFYPQVRSCAEGWLEVVNR